MCIYLSCCFNVGSVTFITIVHFHATLLMEGSTDELAKVFKLIIKHFFHALVSLYLSIKANIYINSIYISAMTCETTLAGLINSAQTHIDAGLTRTVLFGLHHKI